MSHNPVVSSFVQGLKSRTQQNKTAQDLLLYVKTELREMPQDELLAFLDEFNHSIFDMISSADNSEKKGGVLAISKYPTLNIQRCTKIFFSECLVSGDVVNTTTSISRYLNTLRVLFPSSDIGVMELAARTLVKIGQLPGSKGVESFEYDIKQAFEFISDERNEVRTRKAVHKDFD